jgi:ribosome recycling factor
MLEDLKKDTTARMKKCIDAVRETLRRLRTGRAQTSLLEHITVEYYGTRVPLNQVGSVNVEDARTLVVTPWEKQMVPVVEKAILTSDLGLTPATAGTVIRVPLPPMTEQRRKDLVKVVRSEGENGKVSIRNVRREALSDIKELLKEREITEDDERKAHDEIQKLTDRFVAEVDAVLAAKEKEIMDF